MSGTNARHKWRQMHNPMNITARTALMLICMLMAAVTGYSWQSIDEAVRDGTLADVEAAAQSQEVNTYNVYTGETTLTQAVQRDKEKDTLAIVKLLVEKGANVNAANKFGLLPLMAAVQRGKLDVVKFLVEKGADVNAKDKYGHTPLMVAAVKDNFNMVEFLVEKGADVNAKSKLCRTPMSYAQDHRMAGFLKYYGAKDETMTLADGTTYENAIVTAIGEESVVIASEAGERKIDFEYLTDSMLKDLGLGTKKEIRLRRDLQRKKAEEEDLKRKQQIEEQQRLAKKKAEEQQRLAEEQRQRDVAQQRRFEEEQRAKGMVMFQGNWTARAAIPSILADQSEKAYIAKAEEYILSKAKKDVYYIVNQALPNGALCVMAQYDSYLRSYDYIGEMFFLIGANSSTLANEEKYKGDLYWAGTHTYMTVMDNENTVNAYSHSRDLAINVVRKKFGLSDRKEVVSVAPSSIATASTTASAQPGIQGVSDKILNFLDMHGFILRLICIIIFAPLVALIFAPLIQLACMMVLKFKPSFGMAFQAAIVGLVFSIISNTFVGFIFDLATGNVVGDVISGQLSKMGRSALQGVVAFFVVAASYANVIKHPETGSIKSGKACLVLLLQSVFIALGIGAIALIYNGVAALWHAPAS